MSTNLPRGHSLWATQGEISAGEFKDFIGENTPKRQDFIIDNLRVEKDLIEA